MAVGVSHPYYPRDLILPHYVPNDKPLLEILGIFFGIVAVFIVGTWLYTGYVKYLRNSTADRLKICWFMSCALIHSILEGYFSIQHKTLAGDQSFLSQMWKEYGKGDSRYVSSDTFTVCMETITGFIDGPLAFLAVYAFVQNKPYRYVVQMVLSLCQLYGDVLYFSTEVMEDFSHSERGHPLYFWFYFVFLNSLWIVIPGILVWQSWRQMTAVQSTADRNAPMKKHQHLELKSAKSLKSSATSVREGETDRIDELQTAVPQVPAAAIVNGTETTIFFDLETTGLGRDADIVQIAAVSGDQQYSAYVLPQKKMSIGASKVNQIEVRGSKMYHHGKEVVTVPLEDALLGFKEFIEDFDSPLVLGHNIARFDVPILYNSFQKVGMSLQDVGIKGCVDTLQIVSKLYKRGEDVSNFKQSTLITELLHKSYDAHNAVADVESLQELYVTKLKPTQRMLQELLFHVCTHVYMSSVKPLVDGKIVSQAVASKMCKSGLALLHLQLAFEKGGEEGVRSLLKQKVAGQVRVTAATKDLDAVVNFLKC